jgi:predicted nicotinamide N-methyase
VEAEPDLVEEIVPLPGRELAVLRPRDSEALLDEEAFEHEEFLPYWAELWPSALALARAVSTRSLGGVRVVELGCGLGLPSIAAALAGARVLATDWSPDAIALLVENARRNGAELTTAVRQWSDPDALAAGGPWELVLASDVLYERRNVQLLLDLLPRLVDERGEVLLADPGRPPAGAFLELAAREWEIATRADAVTPRVALHRLRRKRPSSPG